LQDAETRLQTRLPPSYRYFLSQSNGTRRAAGFSPRFLPAADLTWLHDSDPDWIERWSTVAYPDTEPGGDDELKDVGDFRPAADALLITEAFDGVMDLLVPVAGRPEWQHWQCYKEGAAASTSFEADLRSQTVILRQNAARSDGHQRGSRGDDEERDSSD
jgi:hypothetical protein